MYGHLSQTDKDTYQVCKGSRFKRLVVSCQTGDMMLGSVVKDKASKQNNVLKIELKKKKTKKVLRNCIGIIEHKQVCLLVLEKKLVLLNLK